MQVKKVQPPVQTRGIISPEKTSQFSSLEIPLPNASSLGSSPCQFSREYVFVKQGFKTSWVTFQQHPWGYIQILWFLPLLKYLPIITKTYEDLSQCHTRSLVETWQLTYYLYSTFISGFVHGEISPKLLLQEVWNFVEEETVAGSQWNQFQSTHSKFQYSFNSPENSSRRNCFFPKNVTWKRWIWNDHA